MNDDFLHRIRVEPPPKFLARLKSRLDLQPPPTTPPKRASTLLRTLTITLFAGVVFAMTLRVLNHKEPQTPVTLEKPAPQSPGTTPPAIAKHDVPKVSTPKTAQETTAAKVNYTVITTKSLEPYLAFLLDNYLRTPGRIPKVKVVNSAADAMTELCSAPAAPKGEPPVALFPWQLPLSESESCTHTNVTAVGHQAIVVARSKLYGPLDLTPAQIFLALASQVPDPAHPDKLIPNPNTVWSDVNSALEREPIEVIGPSPTSAMGLALKETLLEAGCRALPSMTNAKECPDIRTDGVYTEIDSPSEIARQLQARPNAIGVLPYGINTGFAGANEIAPIGGIVPTMATITSGNYPAGRHLYFYGAIQPYVVRTLPSFEFMLGDRYAIIPPERSQQ